MLGRKILYVIGLISSAAVGQPINQPLNHNFQLNTDRYYLHDVYSLSEIKHEDTTANIIANGHRTMRPMIKESIVNHKRGFDTLSRKTTFGDKLFNESLFIIDQPGFYCTIDPAMRFEGGKELSNDSLGENLFWNTRGIDINGTIGKKVGFGSSFYENQARFPQYQTAFIGNHGEFYPRPNGTYQQQNGVVPGMGRTKPFKQTGYDFAFATGYISFTPMRQLNIQMGHGQHFIGSGYRSLFLSDNSFNYPYLRFTSRLWKDKIQYTNVYAGLLNLYRLPEFVTSEATYEKKSGTFHYLSFNLHPKIQFGLFEGIVWERYDTARMQPFNASMLAPVIFMNSAILGSNNQVHNNITGINVNVLPLKNTEFYAQIMLQDLNTDRWGLQIGGKYFDVFRVKDLFLQVEYNKVAPKTYAAVNERRSYSHFNLPLAHPAGGGFDELAAILSYEYRKIFTRWQYHFYSKKRDDDPAFNNGTSIFTPIDIPQNPNAEDGYINFLKAEVGYRFNKTTRLEMYAGFLLREEVYPTTADRTTYVMVGLRTHLRNQYFDF